MKTREIFGAICAVMVLTGCDLDDGLYCGEGTLKKGDACVAKTSFTDEENDSGRIEESDTPAVKCGKGTMLIEENECVATDSSEEIICGNGTHEENGVCKADKTTPPCNEGTREINGECFAVAESMPCEGDNDPYNGLECITIVCYGGNSFTDCHATPGVLLCDLEAFLCNPVCEDEEVCGDGLDNDCNGQVDEGCETNGLACGEKVPEEYCAEQNEKPKEAKVTLNSILGECSSWYISCERTMVILAFADKEISALGAKIVLGPSAGLSGRIIASGYQAGYYTEVQLGDAGSINKEFNWNNLKIPEWLEFSGLIRIDIQPIANWNEEIFSGPVQLEIEGQKTYINVF